MKKESLLKVLSLVLVVLALSMVSIVTFTNTGCKGLGVSVTWKPTMQTAKVAARIPFYTFGYEGVRKDRNAYVKMAQIAETGLLLVKRDETTFNKIIDDMKKAGANAVKNDPLAHYQVTELLSLIDVDLDIDKPTSIPENKHVIVKEALIAFINGVNAGKEI